MHGCSWGGRSPGYGGDGYLLLNCWFERPLMQPEEATKMPSRLLHGWPVRVRCCRPACLAIATDDDAPADQAVSPMTSLRRSVQLVLRCHLTARRCWSRPVCPLPAPPLDLFAPPRRVVQYQLCITERVVAPIIGRNRYNLRHTRKVYVGHV
jgi:hypothetical protein